MNLTLSGDKHGCLVAGPYIHFGLVIASSPLFREVQLSIKEGEMTKPLIITFIFTILTIAFCFPAFAARSVSITVSVTMPEHVMMAPVGTSFTNNVKLNVQTDNLVRNNQSLMITSIVVP